MLASCPKCQTKYDIDDKLVPNTGKKLRCAKCGNVWTIFNSGEKESDADILAKIGGKVQEIAEGAKIETDPIISVEEEPSIIEAVDEPTALEPAVEQKKNPQFDSESWAESSEPKKNKEKDEPWAESPAPKKNKEKDESWADEPIGKKGKDDGFAKERVEEPKEYKEDLGEDPFEREKEARDAEFKKANQKDDMKDIFARISSKTEDIFQKEKELPTSKKIKTFIVRTFGLQSKGSRIFFAAAVVVVALMSSVYAKYEIVKVLPFMENVYAVLGVKTAIPGAGLEFKNVTRREYEEDYVSKMEVKGFIVNTTQKRIAIPEIHVEMLDKETLLLESLSAEPVIEVVEPENRVAFRFVINKPSSLMKYILITFKEKNS